MDSPCPDEQGAVSALSGQEPPRSLWAPRPGQPRRRGPFPWASLMLTARADHGAGASQHPVFVIAQQCTTTRCRSPGDRGWRGAEVVPQLFPHSLPPRPRAPSRPLHSVLPTSRFFWNFSMYVSAHLREAGFCAVAFNVNGSPVLPPLALACLCAQDVFFC